MASPDTRRALAARRRSDRDRKRRQRDAEAAIRAPTYAQIDMSLALAVRALIVDRYGSARKLPPDSDLHHIVRSATTYLGTHGFVLTTEKARTRLRRAIGA